jgi:hypothetical protein
VREILSDPAIQAATSAVVLAATDPVAAWGGALLLDELGLQATLITGPATDNEAGCRSIRQRTARVTVANARTQPEVLTDAVLSHLRFQTSARLQVRVGA